MAGRLEALLFDVFGTLVDWRTGIANHVAREFAQRNISIDPATFADAWRGEYQPAMEPVRNGQRAYVPLDVLHRENLEKVLGRYRIDKHFMEEDIRELSRAWEQLPAWPDTAGGLARLKRDFLVAPCSNGSIALITRLARFAGLSWDAILGADIANSYKPDPEVYLKSVAALGLEPRQVAMVAAHNEDLRAAAACGLATAYLPRPLEHGSHSRDIIPDADWDFVVRDMEELAAKLTG